MTEQPIAIVERHILNRAHRALDHVLVRIETTAEMAGTVAGPELSSLVRNVLDAVDTTLLPHMEWEDQVCYPETDHLAGTPWATQLLRLQHERIRSYLDQLRSDELVLRDAAGHRTVIDLRAHLYALHAFLTSHLEQEEHVLLTLLVAAPAAPRVEAS